MTSLTEIDVKQTVYSTAEGRMGNWALRTTVQLGAVPHTGDSIVFTYGESEITETVSRVYFYTGGRIGIDLRSVVTDSLDTLAELDRRVRERRWEKTVGPWAAQRPVAVDPTVVRQGG